MNEGPSIGDMRRQADGEFYQWDGREWLPMVHDYLSTACYHGAHASCRIRCKYCDVGCRCRCHRVR